MCCLHVGSTLYVCNACGEEKARGNPWSWSSGELLAAMWVLGVKLCSSAKQPVFVTAEPPLQALALIF